MVTRSKRAAARELRRSLAEHAAAARALLDERAAAYASFNRCSDSALLESSILDIRALDVRFGAAMRALKAEQHAAQGGLIPRADSDPAGRRRRADRPAAEAAEKAHQMDP